MGTIILLQGTSKNIKLPDVAPELLIYIDNSSVYILVLLGIASYLGPLRTFFIKWAIHP
jgi:hypothetical protein